MLQSVVDARKVNNLPQMFFDQAKNLSDKPFLWNKENGQYRSLSWKAAADTTKQIASGLMAHAHIKPGDRVLIVSENRPEWIMVDIAIMSLGAISVPTYTTNTALLHQHIISDSGAKVAFVSNLDLAKPLIAAASEADHKVQIVVMDHTDDVPDRKELLITLDDLIKKGKPKEVSLYTSKLSRTDLCSLIYTSGTTGLPKGVMLTHGNLLSNCYGASEVLRPLKIENEVFLSFLPMSHSYEHMAGVFVPICFGSEVYFAERIETLPQNMLEAQPTIMTAVPRLYENMRQKIIQRLKHQNSFRQYIFRKTLDLGIKHYETPELFTIFDHIVNSIGNILVRRKVKARFGGKLKAMLSGGAPLNYDVGVFFHALGITLLQGYGQTEASPLISANIPNRVKLHTCGPPVAGVTAKIATDGEILVQGEMVMKGYWNDPDASIAAVDSDGWLHTGDIGYLDKDDYIVITDRKKDIIINSGGDNISPQRVEGIICLEPAIDQVMVFGDKCPYLSALIVPNLEWSKNWAKKNNAESSLNELVISPDFRRAMSTSLERINAQLTQIEKIKKFIVIPHAFSLENGQITPTLKVRRHAILREYRDDLEALYK
mgnify:CR=1 FL=1